MRFEIDTRPLPIVILSRWWRFPIYLLLVTFLYMIYHQTPPVGLTVEGFRALAIFAACLVLWIFHLLPLPVSGLFALVAPALMGVVSPKEAFSFFGSPTVFFILGVFILAAALLKSGVSTRFALLLLRGGTASPKALPFRVLITTVLLSFFMSRHAVTAMIFPLLAVFSDSLKSLPYGRSYSRLLHVAAAWGCIIGGPATMLAGGRIPLAIGIFREAGYDTISFAEWTLLLLPLVILLVPFATLALTRFFPIGIDHVEPVKEVIRDQARGQGRMFLEERFLVLLTVAAIVAWIFFGQQLGMATIALITVLFLFMFRVVQWKDLEETVNWGIILLYGGAIGLSSILISTGAGRWFTETYLLPHIQSGWMLVALFSLVAILLSEAVNNTAILALLLPIALTLSHSFGLDPKVLVLTLGAACGIAFTLPTSCPALSLAYLRGPLHLRDILLPALLLNLLAWALLLLLAKFWWPLFGIKV